MKIRPVGVTMQTDRHMMKLIVTFYSFVNVPKNALL